MRRIIIILMALLVMTGGAGAKPKHRAPKGGVPETRILAADSQSVTVAGGRGDEQHIYRITEATKVKVNGFDGSANDLKAGMLAKVVPGEDDRTADSIEARHAPKEKHKRPPAGNVTIIL